MGNTAPNVDSFLEEASNVMKMTESWRAGLGDPFPHRCGTAPGYNFLTVLPDFSHVFLSTSLTFSG